MKKEFLIPQGCLDAIQDQKNLTIMILGGADTGKTSLIEYLSDILASKFKVGIVDCDMGQSHIGPPTTIAWGRVGEGFTDWENIKVEDFYFTGSLSPFGNLLPTICGTKIIYDKARRYCNKIIIDTTGLIDEPSGRVLKENKIDLIKPDIVLALQEEAELEHILGFIKGVQLPIVFRLNVPDSVTRKTMATRANYRKEQFDRYFKDAKEIEIPKEQIGIKRIGSGNVDLIGRLVSLRNKNGDDMALGIIRKIDSAKIVIFSPIKEIGKIGCVVVGEVAYA